MMSGVSLQRAFRRISGKEVRWKKSAACGLAWGFGLSKRFADARMFCSGTGKAFYALHIWRIFKRKDFRDAGSRPAGRCFEKAGGKSVRRAR